MTITHRQSFRGGTLIGMAAFVLVVLLAGSAYAVDITYTTTFDPTDAVVKKNSPDYVFPLTISGFHLNADEFIVSAVLSLSVYSYQHQDSKFDLTLDGNQTLTGIVIGNQTTAAAPLVWTSGPSSGLSLNLNNLTDGALQVTLHATKNQFYFAQATLTVVVDPPPPVSTPEPTSILLMGMGLMGFLLWGRRMQTAAVQKR